MTAEAEETNSAGRIEGGIDAIVIGASADGLAAAAYLGKAGLHTILLEESAEIGGAVRSHEIAPGVDGMSGEHLINNLDPDVISELDLYRFGVGYAARRLDNIYYFENGNTLNLDGDLHYAADSLLDDDECDRFSDFMQESLELASFLRPAFAPRRFPGEGEANGKSLEKLFAHAPAGMSDLISRYAVASIEDVLNANFSDGPIKTLLTTEASFLSGAGPHEAFSYMGFLRRLAGEVAGLQGATGFPEGGAVTIINALRRAVQSAKVEIRAASPVRSILIEWDRAAGVVLKNGSQLRAPIIINALDASRTFLDMIEPDVLDIEFQRMLTAPRDFVASAKLHVTFRGEADNDATRENLRRRLVYAPPPELVRRAFIDARAGRVPESPIVEAIFPGALDAELSIENGQILSAVAHPMPFSVVSNQRQRNEISNTMLATLDRIAPGVSEQADIVDLQLPADIAAMTGGNATAYAAKPAIMQQWAFAGVSASASDIGGFYFCGPEAQIGAGISCAAGRQAAKSAVREFKKRGGAL